MTFILQDTPRLVSNCISWLSSHEKHWWIKITILGPKLYIPSGDQRWLAGIPPFLTSILGTFHPDLIQFQHCEGRPLCPGHGDISSYILDIISGDYHQNYLFENLKKPPTKYEMCRTNTTTILTEPDWRRVLAAVSNYYYPSKIRFFQVARIHPEIVTYIPSRKCTEQKKNSVFETRLALGAKKKVCGDPWFSSGTLGNIIVSCTFAMKCQHALAGQVADSKSWHIQRLIHEGEQLKHP